MPRTAGGRALRVAASPLPSSARDQLLAAVRHRAAGLLVQLAGRVTP